MRLLEMVLQFPASFVNQLEMLRHSELQEEEKRSLREEGERKSEVQQNLASFKSAKKLKIMMN